MNIILTHEQADFDGIASVLGAWLLDPQKIAILPSRINRNVAEFIETYQDELPFCDLKSIPPDEKAESALLVDTQSAHMEACFKADTRIFVMDHHQPKDNLPENWRCHFERTGSCTTILIEQLRKKDPHIIPIHLTLLMLGIYEDTGNLTYGNTTVRDIIAAAWLLEKGADLDLIPPFLNPPLSDKQEALFDSLLQNCEEILILGQKIIFATADTREIAEEYSSVAHHLRDMLNPDGLIVLLASRNGVRIICRATNDRINFGKLMKQFNGGGHSRAASSFIQLARSEDVLAHMQALRAEVERQISAYITPPLTVKQIMSARPLVLPVTTSMEDLAEITKRYGFEGYPVTDSDGRLLGLLNRRNVERALDHQLDLELESILDPGDYCVTETDSVDYLKEMMVLSGWGQIPVLSADKKQIIAIVTRTDLIKTLSGTKSVPGNRRLSADLNELIQGTNLRLISIIAEAAALCNYPVYLVGGFVRDLILGNPVKDFDIVVEGDAIHLTRTLSNIHGGEIRTHSRFGTAKWDISDIKQNLLPTLNQCNVPDSVDLISARTEFYDHPTALPIVERSSIKLDLHRRDFTINTLAIRIDGDFYGDLLDFWGGYDDLNNKIIRVLHSLSFTDDPTRMIRAVRFEQRFGFRIENHTEMLIRSSKSMLKQVSGRRILHELDLLFLEASPEKSFRRLDEMGLLQTIHPNLSWSEQNSEDYQKMRSYKTEPYWKPHIPTHEDFMRPDGNILCWWRGYDEKTMLEISKRLILNKKGERELSGIAQLNRVMPDIIKGWPSEVTFFLDRIPLNALYCYNCLSDNEITREIVRKYISVWRKLKPLTTGKDLHKLPYKPGEWMAAVLKRLRKGWIDEEISNTEEEQKTLSYILPFYTKNTERITE